MSSEIIKFSQLYQVIEITVKINLAAKPIGPPGIIPLTAGAASCHSVFSWVGNKELTSLLGLHTDGGSMGFDYLYHLSFVKVKLGLRVINTRVSQDPQYGRLDAAPGWEILSFVPPSRYPRAYARGTKSTKTQNSTAPATCLCLLSPGIPRTVL